MNSGSFWFAAVVKFQKKTLVHFQKENKKKYITSVRDKDYSGEQHLLGGNTDDVFNPTTTILPLKRRDLG